MRDPSLYPYIYAQEITLHVRVSRKFNFLSQLRSLLGIEALEEIIASPIPIIYPILRKNLVWEVYVFVLL